MTENKTQIVVGCFYDYCGICCCKNECYMYKTLDNIKTNVDYQIEGRELEKKELLGIIQSKDKVIAKLKAQIEKMINEIDKTMITSNMREREIYDIQEIFRKYNFRRDSNNKWELKE